MTTFYSYGEVQEHRQGEIMKQLKKPRESGNQNTEDIARVVLKVMAENKS